MVEEGAMFAFCKGTNPEILFALAPHDGTRVTVVEKEGLMKPKLPAHIFPELPFEICLDPVFRVA